MCTIKIYIFFTYKHKLLSICIKLSHRSLQICVSKYCTYKYVLKVISIFISLEILVCILPVYLCGSVLLTLLQLLPQSSSLLLLLLWLILPTILFFLLALWWRRKTLILLVFIWCTYNTSSYCLSQWYIHRKTQTSCMFKCVLVCIVYENCYQSEEEFTELFFFFFFFFFFLSLGIFTV